MEFFRGSASPGIDDEVNAIIESPSMKKRQEGYRGGSLRKLTTISFLKPFSCIGIIYFCCSISGYGAVSAYSNDYFDNAGARAMSYGTDSVILGIVKCIFTFLAPFMLVKLSKKKLFVTCGFLGSIGLILGDYFILCFLLILFHQNSIENGWSLSPQSIRISSIMSPIYDLII